MAQAQEVDVVIVGAGIAGLSAAEHLWTNGLKSVVVLEASGRIGGRIQTEQFGGDDTSLVEMGANYFHGLAMTNSMVTLANKFDLLDYSEARSAKSPFDKATAYRSDGKVISPEIREQVKDLLMAWTEEEDLPPTNLGEHGRKKMEAYLETLANELEEDQIEDVRSLYNNALDIMQLMAGANVNELKAESLLVQGQHVIDSRDYAMSGLSKIVAALRNLIPQDKVLLNKEVTKISLKETDVLVTCGKETYKAKHVVVTSSLGYLKENVKSLFSPPLPAAKLEAIDKTGFGKVGKVFLHWDQPFWAKGLGTMALCFTDKERIMKNETEWYKAVHAFDEVLNNDNVLLAWVGCDGVEAMEKMSDEAVMFTLTGLLRKFLNDPSIPVPSKIKKSNWCSDRLSRGAYSHHGIETEPHHWEDLEAPVCRDGVPRIMFAGEAIRCNSCMHGARSSALREAENILNLFGLQKVPKL